MKIIVGFLILGLSLPYYTHSMESNDRASNQTQKPDQQLPNKEKSFWGKYKTYIYHAMAGITLAASIVMLNKLQRDVRFQRELKKLIAQNDDIDALQKMAKRTDALPESNEKKVAQKLIAERITYLQQEASQFNSRTKETISTISDTQTLKNISTQIEQVPESQTKEDVIEIINEQLGSIKRQSGKPGRG